MRPNIAQIVAFIKLGRFLFLGGGFVMFALGAAMAVHHDVTIKWQVYILGQAIVTTTQLMVHYSNDYFDFAADQHNTGHTFWSGGSRILPRGELPPRVALIAAIILLVIAVGLTLVMPLVSISHSL